MPLAAGATNFVAAALLSSALTPLTTCSASTASYAQRCHRARAGMRHLDGFADRYPSFQLEDELLVEGWRDVMWGRQYQRHSRVRSAGGSAEQAPATISG
ncbi:hypothetical protein PVAP13_3KG410904 [Panicum virgatum]|uniref:Uncharacterized protein n=1 Tax=Panicum virgatum TaxID=38727 RepID=A0A8T0VB84_PANVG|nr:hypothetical protein PVAP13_3KG410904 [Panicum virgatum]